jgi:hypothetical protein
MPRPTELRQSIIDTRAELQAALHEVHQKWEVKPASGENEDARSPQEVARHVIGADWFFTEMNATRSQQIDRASTVALSARLRPAYQVSSSGSVSTSPHVIAPMLERP